jgi:glutamine amidotransferase/cyclase
MPVTMPESRTVWVLDYGAGNIRSVLNAIQFLGFEPKFVENVDQLRNAPRLLFPGVGAFGR